MFHLLDERCSRANRTQGALNFGEAEAVEGSSAILARPEVQAEAEAIEGSVEHGDAEFWRRGCRTSLPLHQSSDGTGGATGTEREDQSTISSCIAFI